MYVCMYVCIEVALCGDAHGKRAFQLGQGRDPSGLYVCIEVTLRGDAHGIGCSNWAMGGPIGIVGPISQPRGTNGTASLTLDHTYALYFTPTLL